MLFNPAIIALTIASLLVGTFSLYACGMGTHILLKWNLQSADETQLRLERRTYLISSILGHVFAIELMSMFMFVATADHLHTFITGAMCAAGVLNANAFGNPTLILRVASFLCCGIWLVANRVDAQTFDFPLLRFKYGFLLIICPLLIAESAVQLMFLASLDPQVLTSCCGVVFGSQSQSLAAEVSHLPPGITVGLFYAALGIYLGVGARFIRTGRGDWLSSLLSAAVFVLAAMALISYFCLFVYESPRHHCPYCLLQKEYHFVGYVLYAALLVGAVTGCSVGILGRFRKKTRLTGFIAKHQRRLCWTSMLAYGFFTVRVHLPILFGDFVLTV